jgi:hypothetical protein
MKNNNSFISFLFLVAIIAGVFYFMMPQSYDTTEAPLSEFSTQRAYAKVKAMTSKPHFVGSKNHEEVAQYLINELKNIGLQPIIQEGFTLSYGGTLVKSKNILAKIKGASNSKALLLLSHYDSAPHSYSHGASDDASGVATILESVRAFLHTKTQHKNDIIILFSDAEELGLNGAALFVTQQNWAKEVGVVLNLEARGSSGPSYMLMETNKGNAKMVEAFRNGKVKYPVSNSLMYSIYKMLPNDTDLTVFREQGKIQGYNFAFIDNHFNYHTQQDTAENLNKQTLEHQGSYVMPLLNYFSNADISNLNSSNDNVYFNIPFGFLYYPFEWILPMLIVAFALFFVFMFIGLGKHILRLDEIIKGFVSLVSSIILAGVLTYIGWKLLLSFYPNYQDILQGFTYNGHDYIYAFVCLTLSVCFFIYQKKAKQNPEMNQSIAPLFLWLLINVAIAFKLKGGAFFIIPVLSSLLMLGVYVLTQKSYSFINLILSIPTLVLILPFIQMLPIGLGLKMLFVSAILTVLCFGLLLPIFGAFSQKRIWSLAFLLLSIGLFAKAHFASDFEINKTKPNSLLYVIDGETDKAHWVTYDENLDQWTKRYLGENPKDASVLNKNKLYSKYGSQYSYMADAPKKAIPKPTIQFLRDTIKGNQHIYKIRITPNRDVNRYDVFVNAMTVQNLKANGVTSLDFQTKIGGKVSNKLLSYYVVDNLPLEMEFSIPTSEKINMDLVESSFNLMGNPFFKMAKRTESMMPTPFVLNDAIVITQKIKPTIHVVEEMPKPFLVNKPFTRRDSTRTTIDTIK